MFEAPSMPKTIRYGLGAIKGVGHGAVEAIVEAARAAARFRDLADFCRARRRAASSTSACSKR